MDILLGGNPEGLAREKLRKQKIEITEATPEQWNTALAEAKAECERDRQIVVAAGGLYVIGTERHEARRIDNQLRGRSGRQGDPGMSQFYLSLEDDLMRRFGGDRVKGLMRTLRMPEDEPIRNRLISQSIQQAQIRIEGYNFDLRKQVLKYDDVVNKQREAIYKQRQELIESENLRERVEKLIADEIQALVEDYWTEIPPDSDDEGAWNPEELYREALKLFPVPAEIQPEQWTNLEAEDVALALIKGAIQVYDQVEQKIVAATGKPELIREIERDVMLRAIDQFWVRHLTDLDVLREGIWSVAIGQRDPVVEYKRESFKMWEALQGEIRRQIITQLLHIEVSQPPPQTASAQAAADNGKSAVTTGGVGSTIGAKGVKATHQSVSAYDMKAREREPRPQVSTNREGPAQPITADVWAKTGRNDPCPCGSGKKFKNCHYPILREQKATASPNTVNRAVPPKRR